MTLTDDQVADLADEVYDVILDEARHVHDPVFLIRQLGQIIRGWAANLDNKETS